MYIPIGPMFILCTAVIVVAIVVLIILYIVLNRRIDKISEELWNDIRKENAIAKLKSRIDELDKKEKSYYEDSDSFDPENYELLGCFWLVGNKLEIYTKYDYSFLWLDVQSTNLYQNYYSIWNITHNSTNKSDDYYPRGAVFISRNTYIIYAHPIILKYPTLVSEIESKFGIDTRQVELIKNKSDICHLDYAWKFTHNAKSLRNNR